MKWLIPAKTFLLGEYAALAEESAIILTTNPYFELTLGNQKEFEIHPQSPAGIWWQKENCLDQGLVWQDPYNGIGGLGASSAQFLASYLVSCALKNTSANLHSMLEAYYQVAWSGTGLRPSGYDVIAQSQNGCVFINKQQKLISRYDWVFQDLSFFLIHTGIKLATHQHLQETTLPQVQELSMIVDAAHDAFQNKNSQQLVRSINDYHQKLLHLNLVASHSEHFIKQFKNHPEVLAIKGCGALGSDVLLIITSRNDAPVFRAKLNEQPWLIVATEQNLTSNTTATLLNRSL